MSVAHWVFFPLYAGIEGVHDLSANIPIGGDDHLRVPHCHRRHCHRHSGRPEAQQASLGRRDYLHVAGRFRNGSTSLSFGNSDASESGSALLGRATPVAHIVFEQRGHRRCVLRRQSLPRRPIVRMRHHESVIEPMPGAPPIFGHWVTPESDPRADPSTHSGETTRSDPAMFEQWTLRLLRRNLGAPCSFACRKHSMVMDFHRVEPASAIPSGAARRARMRRVENANIE